MKIVSLAVLTASFLTLAMPGFAQARMRLHSSHHIMMHGHHRLHTIGRSGGRMPASHNF